MANYNNKPTISKEEIDAITKEVNDFQQKSIQLAASQPTLSAHYWRLYQASAPSLKRFDRMRRSAEKKEAAKQRKSAREGAAPKPASGPKA